MTFARQLERLRQAAAVGMPGCPPSKVTVDVRDLRELLHHFDRIDAELRTIHQQAVPQAVATGWIDPNDKTQKQFLPHIGEPVLFCHEGVTYYGIHTGGSFKAGQGVTARLFGTWDCMWMYKPAAARRSDRPA